MGPEVTRIRDAARSADVAAKTPAAIAAAITSAATGAVFLGDVTTVSGEVLSAYRTANGSLIAYGNRGTALGFDPDGLTELRELLDRCAMPGQEG